MFILNYYGRYLKKLYSVDSQMKFEFRAMILQLKRCYSHITFTKRLTLKHSVDSQM